MKVKTAKRLIIAAIIAVVVTATISTWLPTRPEYEITDLSCLGPSAHIRAINNHAQVVGWLQSSSTGDTTAFVWDPIEGKTEIVDPQGRESYAMHINDRGEVVGYLTNPSTKHNSAFIWDKDTGITELGTVGGHSSRASAINNQGQVVGWSMTSNGQTHAFIWDKANGMRDLGTLGGNHSWARDINDKGQVVANSILSDGQRRASIWEESTGMVEIGTLDGGYSSVESINNAGTVVGTIEKKGHMCGFIWQKGKGMKELEFPGQSAFPLKINDSRQIVGVCFGGGLFFLNVRQSYFLWHPDRGSIELDAILHPKGHRISHIDINNKGQIAGIQTTKDGNDRGVILTPKGKSNTEGK